jgi:hypothetical protein
VDRRLNQRKNLWIFNRPTFGTSESKLTKLDGQNGGWSASICIKTLVNVFDPQKFIKYEKKKYMLYMVKKTNWWFLVIQIYLPSYYLA